MIGLILKSTGSWYEVQCNEDDQIYLCRTRGKLRLAGLKTTNPIAVGDLVEFVLQDDGNGLIENILPRDNYIIRKSIKNKHHGHIIAANIDQSILVVTLKYPRTSLGFIDRFLVSAEAFRIPQILVFNKIDLLNKEEHQQLEDIIATYAKLGIKCIISSTVQNIGISEVSQVLRAKKTLISGHSGVGKSTLINALDSNLNIKTSEISDFAEKGVHTTTFATMHILSDKSYLIDTPGIKELGLIDIESNEIADYFPEMRALLGQCKFHNCLHTKEPGCAVKEAVNEGNIAVSRYQSYQSMMEDHDSHH